MVYNWCLRGRGRGRMIIKTTTRGGIRRNFNKVSNNQWAHFFDREKENGLIAAREITIAAKTAMPAQCAIQYNIKKVAQWLVDHGLYTLKEIKEVL